MTPSERYRARLELNAMRAARVEMEEDGRRYTRNYIIATVIAVVLFVAWKALK